MSARTCTRNDFFELTDEEARVVKNNSLQHKLLSVFKELYEKDKSSYVLIPKLFLKLCQNTGSESVNVAHKKKPITSKRVRHTNDLATSVFLSHLLYLTGKGHREDGFIWKSATEWHEETGLTPHQVRQAAAWCKKKGLIENDIYKHDGRDTNHYRICQKELVESIRDAVIEDKINNPILKQMSKDGMKRLIDHVQKLFDACIPDKPKSKNGAK